MGHPISGATGRRAPSIHDFIAAGAASSTDLTELTSVKKAPSSGMAIVTATSIALAWKDGGANEHSTGTLTAVVGDIIPLPPGMTELTTNTGLACFLYWDP